MASDRSCLACKFCGAGLWVKSPTGYPTLVAPARVSRREAVYAWDRRLKKCGSPLSRSQRQAALVYVPFWRISAIVAAPEIAPCRSETDDENPYLENDSLWLMHPTPPRRQQPMERTGDWTIKPWDLTVPAFAEGTCGLASLGIRSKTVSLVGWDRVPDVDSARCLSSVVDEGSARSRYEQTVGSVLTHSRGALASESIIIAPKFSLIYWPVWFLSDQIDGRHRATEIDGVSGRVIQGSDNLTNDIGQTPVNKGEAPVLSPHRCPACGRDLAVNVKQVVFCCDNCRTLVAHESCGRRRVVSADFAISNNPDRERWYPFWVFDDGDILVPAFAIRNYRVLVRFGTMVSGQTRDVTPETDYRRRLGSVILHQDVAAGLADLIRRRRGSSPGPSSNVSDSDMLAHEPDSGDSPRLLYAHLRHTGAELVDPCTGLCLTRSALVAS